MTAAARRHVVIVGAGLAGGRAALALRRQGFDGQVTLVGQEGWPPYDRPPLSKGYLRREEHLDAVVTTPSEEYAAQRIDLRPDTHVAQIDARLKIVELDGGAGAPRERLRYDRLLVTTGSRNRRSPASGADLDGVIQLRTIEQSDRINSVACRRDAKSPKF